MQMRDEVAQVLLSGSNPWARIDFRYDWMGRRISKMYQTTNDDPAVYGTKTGPPITWSIDRCVRYVWDGWHLSLSYRANPNGAYVGPDQSFAWGPDLSSSYGGAGGAGGVGGLVAYCDDDFDTNNPSNDPDLGPMYPIYDGNGNVVRMCRFVPSAGDWDVECRTAAAYEYGPFGEALSVTGEDLGPGGGGGGGQGQRNPFRFSTEYTDAETGLVYYGYRYYSPGMGRWVSRDPIGESDRVNLFAFVGNSPIANSDLLGLVTMEQINEVAKNVGITQFNEPLDPKKDWSTLIKNIQTQLGVAVDADFGPGTVKAYEDWAAANGKPAVVFRDSKTSKQVLDWIIKYWKDHESEDCAKKCPITYGHFLAIIHFESRDNTTRKDGKPTYFNAAGGPFGAANVRTTAVGLGQFTIATEPDRQLVYDGERSIKRALELLFKDAASRKCDFDATNPNRALNRWEAWRKFRSEIDSMGKRIADAVKDKHKDDWAKISKEELDAILGIK